MDDYRDIGASDFERYEKIREVFEQIVTDFNLVTNASPGTLRVDPVVVTYDLGRLAQGPAELTLETPSFDREIIEVSITGVTISGTSRLEIPFLDLLSGVIKILGSNIDVANNSGVDVNVQYVVSDNRSASQYALAEYTGVADSTSLVTGYRTEAISGGTPARYIESGVATGLVLGSNQFIRADIIPSGVASGTINVDAQFYVERKT